MMKDMTSGNESKLIFFFALPMLIGNVLQQLYNTVDGIIVGRFVGKNALAAVGASFPIIFLLVALMMGLGMGATVLISQFYGAKDYKNVIKTIDTVIISTFAASIVVSIVGLFISKPIMILLNTPEDIIAQATTYLNIIFSGLIGLIGYNLVSAILRGLGDSKNPLYFLLISTVINISLDIFFVLFFGWGVMGVAWATVIAQTTAFIIGVIKINKNHEVIKISFKNIQFNKTILVESIKVGLPMGIQNMLFALGIVVLQGMINSFGTTIIAGYTAGTRIHTFGLMPIMNFSMAISAFVGQNLGAGNYDRVQKGYKSGLIMSIITALLFTFISYMFGEKLVLLFNNESEVITIGYQYLMIISSFYIFAAFMFSTFGVLRGAGDTVTTMIISIVALWAVRIPFATIFVNYIGYSAVFWSAGADWGAGLIISLIYFKRGKWKDKVSINNMKKRRIFQN